jgi:hypothetical protein
MGGAMRLVAALLLAAAAASCSDRGATIPTSQPQVAMKRPDFSGFWNLDTHIARDPELMSQVAPDTVFIDDTGPVELPLGDYGGLLPTAAALAHAREWNPRDALSVSNACRAPSIVYALQGPFPIEIFQSDTLIVMKLEYYDLVRIIFLDARTPEPDYPHSPTGFSLGHWEGSTLVVETDLLEPGTITNNGLDHTQDARVVERFRLSADGHSLLATQEFEDRAVITNRGVRFIGWTRVPGQHVYPYECDPGFAGNYDQKSAK